MVIGVPVNGKANILTRFTADITYASLAKAFSQNLVLHAETLRRMDAFYKRRSSSVQETPQQKQAAHRMALLPDGGEVLFVDDQMWVVGQLLRVVHMALTYILACGPTSREAIRATWYTYPISESFGQSSTISFAPPFGRKTTAHSNPHRVSVLNSNSNIRSNDVVFRQRESMIAPYCACFQLVTGQIEH